MIIYLVRHGESIANLEKITAGHLDSHLTYAGEEQARKVGLRFKEIDDFEVIYTSDLTRAYHTASKIHKFHSSKELVTNSHLREKHFGDLEGQSRELSKKKFTGPAIFWSVENGETFHEHKQRVEQVLEEILRIGKNCVIVNHGITLKMILLLLMAAEDEERVFHLNPKNTAVYKVEITPNGVQILIENCIKHLEEDINAEEQIS
jgi:broad specificity phosphatase PhoE